MASLGLGGYPSLVLPNLYLGGYLFDDPAGLEWCSAHNVRAVLSLGTRAPPRSLDLDDRLQIDVPDVKETDLTPYVPEQTRHDDSRTHA